METSILRLLNLIVDATGLECNGLTIVKKILGKYQRFIDNFFEEGEQTARMQNGYDRLNFPPLYMSW